MGAAWFAIATMTVGAATVAAAAEVQIASTPIQIDASDPARTRVGALEYRGGLRLRSTDPAFGGLSGLRIAGNGNRLLAVSDRGFWLQAELTFDGAGTLTGLAGADLSPMLNTAGRPERVPRTDAESIVLVAGVAMVGFERQHRIALYPLDSRGNPADARPTEKPVPAALARAPINGGIEAMTALADGRLFVIAEALVDGDGLAAWLLEPGAGASSVVLQYVPAPGFQPTGAATLADGDVLVLERRFTVFERAARIVRIPATDLRAGARLVGVELARLASPLQVDNFEGIEVVPAPGGGTHVYLLSDDNFSLLQRTLLLQFWMP